MQSVTSNAVASKFVYFKVRNVTKNIGNKTYFTITDFFPDVTNDYIMVAGHGDTPQQNLTIMETTTNGVDTSNSNLICMVGKNTDFSRNTNYTLSFDIFAIKKEMFYERTS